MGAGHWLYIRAPGHWKWLGWQSWSARGKPRSMPAPPWHHSPAVTGMPECRHRGCTFPITSGGSRSIWATEGGGKRGRSQPCVECGQVQPSLNNGSSHVPASAVILGLKAPWVRNLPLQGRKKSTTNGCSLKTLYFPLSPSWFKRPLIITAAKAGFPAKAVGS